MPCTIGTIEKISQSISQAILLGFLLSIVSTIGCEANKSNRRRQTARTETHRLAHSQNVVGPAAECSLSSAACGSCKSVCQSESTYAQRVDLMSRIVTHNRLRDDSLENATCARRTQLFLTSKKLRVGKSTQIQLGFSRSPGSVTSNEANKSAMLRTEWSITARQAVFHSVQKKYQ